MLLPATTALFLPLVILSPALLAPAHVHAAEWPLELFDLAKFPRATCNDGSPAGVWTRRHPSAKAWIVHLQGGFWCWDEESCLGRQKGSPQLTSSLHWPKNLTSRGGMFSEDCSHNPGLCEFNVLFAGYCSSDTWSGNNDAAKIGNGQTWSFRGAAILDALVETYREELRAANSILFSGCSAGGQGVVVNADGMFDRLRKVGFTGSYRSFADAGWMQNVPPVRETVSVETQLQKGDALWKGLPNARCLEANPGRAWVCYVSPVAVPFIQSPILVQSNQYDAFQLPYDCCTPPLKTRADETFALELRNAFRSSMSALVVPPHHRAFSAACFQHCIAQSVNTYRGITIDGTSLQEALHDFIFANSTAAAVNHISSCNGVNCEKGCPPLPQEF